MIQNNLNLEPDIMLKKSLAFSLLLLLFTACDEELVSNPILIETEIHLISGFSGNVVIKSNEVELFRAYLSGIESLAGPQAKFLTYFPMGSTELTVRWGTVESSGEDSGEVQIGSANKYYIGLLLSDSTMVIIIRDTQFQYI